MKKASSKLFAACCGFTIMLAAGWAIAQDSAAIARLTNKEGREIGTATFTEGPNGLLLHAELHDLPSGTLAFHLHTMGSCAPDFNAAGGHYNPGKKKHGFMAADGVHQGDMPNLYVPDSGKLTVDFFLPGLSLDKGEAPLLDQDGTSVMIHGKADDYRTDPAGNAGDRIACGTIRKG